MHNNINIAISGLSLQSSNELKTALRDQIPTTYELNWIHISDPHVDLLLINDAFFDTSSIQGIIEKKNCPILKIAKNLNSNGDIFNDTLSLPLNNKFEPLKAWIELNILSKFKKSGETSSNEISSAQRLNISHDFFKKMYAAENTRLHLFDQHGTLAVIDLRRKTSWAINPQTQFSTDHSFQYELAKMNDLTKVSRKHEYVLEDWIWNLIWSSPTFNTLSDGIEHFKINYWPQPYNKNDQKIVFQMSASFIEGASIHAVAQKFDLPLEKIKQFIASCIATNNGGEITAVQSHFSEKQNKTPAEQAEKGFLNGFFGKLRRRFGL